MFRNYKNKSAFLLLVLFALTLWNSVNCQAFLRIDNQQQTELIGADSNNRIQILIQNSVNTQNDKPDSAIVYAKRALEISGTPRQKLECSMHLAEIYNDMIKYDLAVDYAIKTVSFAAELKDRKSLAGAYRILGVVYMYIGDYEASSENLFSSLKIYDEEQYKQGKARVLSNIGTFYFLNENYGKSLEYILKSIDISKEIMDTVGISVNYNNMATCYASMGLFEDVKKYINEAILLNEKLGLKLQVGVNYQNLGKFYMENQMYDSALFFLRKAETIYLNEKGSVYLPNIYIDFSEYYKKTGNQKMHADYALMAFQLSKKNNLKRSKIASAELLYDFYISQNDFEKACRFGSIRYQLRDSLKLMESMVKISRLEFQYQNEQKEIFRKSQQQKRDIIILFVVIVLILCTLLLLLLFTKQKVKNKNIQLEQQRLQDEVEFKNKELTTNVMDVIKKNELLSEIEGHLIEISRKTTNKETKTEIFNLTKEIEQSMGTRIWEEFEKRFSSVHNSFYNKLIEKYPSLTPNELKLCAFLRLNLTSKDISQLTGQQISAIEVARYRIRKKLNINNTETNLVIFLSQI